MGRHKFETYVDDPPSIAQGGRRVVVPGCPMCKVDPEVEVGIFAALADYQFSEEDRKKLEAYEGTDSEADEKSE
jgi:hypothetical protein